MKKIRAKLAIQKRWELKRQLESTSAPSPSVSSGIVKNNPLSEPSTVLNPNEQSSEPMSTDGLFTNIRKTDFIKSDIHVGLDDFDAAPKYLFVKTSSPSRLITSLVCPNCFMSNLNLFITKKVGFNACLSVECTNCTLDIIVLPKYLLKLDKT